MAEIEVTDVDTVKLVKAAYALSVPRGMGLLLFQPGHELSDEEAKSLIDPDGSVYMDYVHGRGCKFSVRVKDGRKFIYSPWYDHTDDDVRQLLKMVGREEASTNYPQNHKEPTRRTSRRRARGNQTYPWTPAL